MKTNYKEILDRFTASDDIWEWAKKPFTIGKYSYATDGITIVRTPKVERIKTYKPNKIKFPFLFANPNMDCKVSVQELEEIVKAAPLIDEKVPISTTCSECDGSGQVYWEYDCFQELFDCPICNGFGKNKDLHPTGKKIFDETASVKVGTCRFYLSQLKPIIQVAKDLGEKQITIIYQTTDNHQTIMKISHIFFLMMSLKADLIGNVCGKIELKNQL